MLISHRHKFIFIHIHKVAGTSISHALRPYASWPCESLQTKLLQKIGYLPSASSFADHVPAARLRREIGSERYEQYYKFAFVRNPWDWQVSLYKYISRNPTHAKYEMVKAMGSFENYLKWRVSLPKHKPWSLQKNLISDSEGKLIVDFVGRYENIVSDFETALENIGIAASLPHLNKGKQVDYRSYYTKETCNMVSEYYREDIETFGYCQPVLEPAS